MTPTLHLHLLGDFLLVSGDAPVTTVVGSRLQSLLAYLVLHRNAPQDRSRLAFLLWPDSSEAQAHTNLRKLLYQLRQALPDADHFLHIDSHIVQWRPDKGATWTLDVLEVEQELARAVEADQRQDRAVLRRVLEQAVRLYRGDLLPHCYDEWILPERDRLRQEFVRAAERLIKLLEMERDYDAAVVIAQRLLHQDPLQEAVYRQLMCLHALRGDRVTALRIYHTCAATLERELGVEPSQATRQIYESLLQREAEVSTAASPSYPVQRGSGAPLIGRVREWAMLQEIWQRVLRGHPHLVALSGEAGVGKTRLAEEMEAWVSRQGMKTASARCYATEGRLAYAPVATWLHAEAIQPTLLALDDAWLTEVVRLAPEVLAKRTDLPRPVPMTEAWQRQRFFAALAHAFLAVRQPLLLLLDDMQWCDNETLEWIHYLLRFEPQAPLLLIGTVRSEETLPDHPLLALLGVLQRDALVTEIALGPLSLAETTSLAEQVARESFGPVTAERLYQESEGNPLFVVEMVRAGTGEQGEQGFSTGHGVMGLHPLSGPPASLLPAGVQSVLFARLAQLSPQAREVAYVAGVIGRAFAFAVLARASGESEDTVVRGLDELWQRRIVREQSASTADAYDFSHDKLREQAYASLSPARRRLLHRRVAEAFEVVYARDLDAVSGQIAAHYERSGLAERAIPYYQRAGEIARRIYANAEAIRAFQHATQLLESGAQGYRRQEQGWEVAVAIYAALGDIYAMTGRQPDARQAYQLAQNWLPPEQYIWQARLLRKTASTWNLASDNPLDTFHINARRIFQEAERILEQASDRSSAEWVHEWIDLQTDQLLPLRGSTEEMTAIIEKAQAVVEQHGTAEQRGRLFQAVAARDAIRDRYTASEETVTYCHEALAALQQTGERSLIGFAHFVLANRLLWLGHLDEAESEMRAAIDIAEQIGNTTLLVRCLTFLPLIFRRRGQVEEVRGMIARAQALPEARNIAIIKGNRAWVAWRGGDLVEAEAAGRDSVEERQNLQGGNAFRWTGLWPLIGVMLVQERTAEAIEGVRMLLDPTQQPPPAELEELLKAILQRWDAGEQDEARNQLQQMRPLAERMGYL